MRYYIDLGYIVINTLPTYLEGETYIKTSFFDKNNTSETFMNFSVSVDATVYVAYDNGNGIPNWLANNFTDTGGLIYTSYFASDFKVYAKDVSAGEVILGGNQAAGVHAPTTMYIELTHKLKKICEFFEYSISVSVWAVNFHKKHNKCTEILSGKKFFQ